MNQDYFGKFIANLRKEKNLTQEELAEKLGVSNKSISRWENGKCMPDYSLLNPLSEIFNVSINELMSGKRISKAEYQEQLEKNIINAISDVDNSNEKQNLIFNIFITIVIVLVGCFIGYVFYINFKFVKNYDEINMKVEYEENDDESIYFSSAYSGSFRYLITTYIEDNEEIGVIFITYAQTLENMVHDDMNYTALDLTNRLHVSYSISLKNTNIPNKFKVYYTTVSFKRIAKANNDELKKIISKSNFMYDKE